MAILLDCRNTTIPPSPTRPPRPCRQPPSWAATSTCWLQARGAQAAADAAAKLAGVKQGPASPKATRWPKRLAEPLADTILKLARRL